MQADKTQPCNAIKLNVWKMEPFELSHLYSFAWKCQINYFLLTWWREILIKGHMNNGRCCLGNATLKKNKWPRLPADNRVERRLITHVNRSPMEPFRSVGKHNCVEHSRFFSTPHLYLFVFSLVFGFETLVLMPFLPQDVSSNQRLHRCLWVRWKIKRLFRGSLNWTHRLILPDYEVFILYFNSGRSF